MYWDEKNVRIVNMLPGVKIEKSAQTKDELSLVLGLGSMSVEVYGGSMK